MKGSCALLASVLAASTTVALSSGDPLPDAAFNPCSNEAYSSSSSSSSSSTSSKIGVVGIISNSGMVAASSSSSSDHKGKMGPRFDGLKFIETLVTAHR